MFINNNLLILFLLNLFILGIKKTSFLIFLKYKILPFNIENKEDLTNFTIALLLGVFLFCILSNFILLIPSLIFLINSKISDINYYITFSTYTLKIVVIILSLIGLIDLLKINKIFKNRQFKIDFKYTQNLFISLFISSLIYLIFSPKSISSGIHYDTGLYHLPFINHLSKFTIEPGLGNLHFRYAFYGISFFGQVPFQMFIKNTNYLSPSLNISFLGIYIAYFLPYLRVFRFSFIKNLINNKVILFEEINSVSILYFCISIILYTGGIFKSLASYSLDLPLFICGSIGFHLIILSFFNKYKYIYFIPIFWLAFFSPIIKLTGVTFTLFFVLLLFFNFTKAFIIDNKKYKFTNTFKSNNQTFINWFRNKLNIQKPYINYKLSIFLIITTLLVFILTNYVISGYAIYPTEFLGPLNSYAIDSDFSERLSSGSLDWHRFQNKPVISRNWFLIYLNSRNGFINILFWFIPSISSLIMVTFISKNYRNKKFKLNINNLLFSLTIVILISFLTLIPLVNYYPWTPHCIIFLMLILLNRIIRIKNININFLKLTSLLFSLFIVLNSIFSYSNSKIIKNIPSSIFKEPLLKMPDHEKFDLVTKKWISFSNLGFSKDIQISVPLNGDQCWGIEPPCTPSTFLLKEKRLFTGAK